MRRRDANGLQETECGKETGRSEGEARIWRAVRETCVYWGYITGCICSFSAKSGHRKTSFLTTTRH
jgi:hypothetical protein